MATAATLSPTDVQRSPVSGVLTRPDIGRLKPRGSFRRESLENSLGGSAQTPTNDPLRILAPAQKKLTTIEAQRILSVMDEAARRLEGAMILPFLVDSLQRFSVSLGSELVTMVEEYQQLVSEYNSLHETLESQGITPKVASFTDARERTPSASSLKSSGSSGRPPLSLDPLMESDDNLEERFYQVQHRLKHCIKSILRMLNKNPSTTSILQTGGKERSRAALQLLEAMGDLRGVMHEQLLTTRMEEGRREEHLCQVVERQQSAELQIQRLETQLAEAQLQKNEEVAQKNALIRRLKTDIKTVINLAEDANRRVRTEASKQREEHLKAHENRSAKVNEDMSSLTRNFQEMVVTNRENEQTLRKRAFKRETEVENWIQKYDLEMGEKQDELEGLQEEFDEEEKQLKELDERLEILSIEYDVVVKEQEEARKRADEANKKMKEMLWAATVIQSFWRVYRCRRKLQKEQQKGKKGQKGKGKGKGKGKKK